MCYCVNWAGESRKIFEYKLHLNHVDIQIFHINETNEFNLLLKINSENCQEWDSNTRQSDFTDRNMPLYGSALDRSAILTRGRITILNSFLEFADFTLKVHYQL